MLAAKPGTAPRRPPEQKGLLCTRKHGSCGEPCCSELGKRRFSSLWTKRPSLSAAVTRTILERWPPEPSDGHVRLLMREAILGES